jgi:hypothetical protein
MLTDRFRQLLTGYVDGELGSRQRKAVLRLLRRSPEARTLLRQLQEDAARLRDLPRQHLAPDFPARVLQAASERQLHPGRRRLARLAAPPMMLPAWSGLAVAASVLLLVGFASFVYFTQALSDGTNGGAVVKNGDDDQQPGRPDRPDAPPAPAPDPRPPDIAADNPPKPDGPAPGPTQVADVPPKEKSDAAGDPMADTRLTSPIPKLELFQPKAVEAALPLILKFGDLDVGKLREELQKDSGYRLEVPCRESARAFDRLQGALKARGVGLLIDQVAQARLKQPKLHTNFVLYAEDLTPDDLTKVLQQAAEDDKKAEARRKGDGQLDGLVVTRMSKEDREELSRLLGVAPSANAPLALDPKTPLSETTAKQVAQALAGQGGASRADTAKSAAKPPEPAALVLPYNPERPRPGSPEVKRFLDARKPPRPGTVQVLLVLRETAG